MFVVDREVANPFWHCRIGGPRLTVGDSVELSQLESSMALGATEIAYQPAGPDIARELGAFVTAVRG